MDMLHATIVMAIFVTFLPILAKIRLPWQRPLDPCNQATHAIRNVFFGLPDQENPVISNHILVISHSNAFIHIYSNFSPKTGCHGNAPLSLLYGGVTDEFPDSRNPISKPKLYMDMSHTTEVMTIFVIFLAILANIWLPWQRPLDPCKQKCLLWID